jgi:hypothetical protein
MIKNKKGSWPVNEENKKIECWVRGFQEFTKRRPHHAKAVLPVFFSYCLLPIAYCLLPKSRAIVHLPIFPDFAVDLFLSIASESVDELIGIRTTYTQATGTQLLQV